MTKAEVDEANEAVGQRTEAGMTDEQSYWYCIEGGAEWAKKITAGAVPVTGSIYVDQYGDDAERFTRAVAQALRDTDGLMLSTSCTSSTGAGGPNWRPASRPETRHVTTETQSFHNKPKQSNLKPM